MYNCLYFTTPIDNFYKDLKPKLPNKEKEDFCFSNEKFYYPNFFLKNKETNISPYKISKFQGSENSLIQNESTEISETSSIYDDSFSLNSEENKVRITESFKIDWKKCIKIFKNFSRINYQNQIKRIDLTNNHDDDKKKIRKNEETRSANKKLNQRKKHKKPLISSKINDNHY